MTEPQLRRLEAAFHAGAAEASEAMAKWLAVPSMILIESLDQKPLAEVSDLLGDPETTLCVCAMDFDGSLSGQLVFAFEDACGLSLTDLLLNQPVKTATEWGEIEQSAALESANIIGCAYLNSLARQLSVETPTINELIPSPPTFQRDFAESLLQSLFMSQAVVSNTVFLARARFEIRGQPLNWTLLLVPDATSMAKLQESLPNE
ncbi:chemotaxis protein CheC [Symmachiella macrocystis]|nr:chemotaxis protein CheC [Symmachiella macrocystis]